MYQVCFTAGFPEWGKGSREGYSIYYYARAGARASGSCKNEPENADFPAGKSRKKCENDENWEKNFFPCTGKTWELSRWQGKTCPKLGNGKRKKRIFLLKKFRRSIKNTGMRWKISQFRMEKAADFFPGERKNAEKHGKRSWKIYRIIRKRHEKYTADRNKFCHWRTVGLKKTDFSTGKVERKKQKNPQSA